MAWLLRSRRAKLTRSSFSRPRCVSSQMRPTQTESSSDTNTSGTSSGSTSEGGNDEVAGDTTDTGESGGAGSDAGCSCAIPSGDAERGQTLGGLLGMLGVFGMRLVRRRRRTG